MYDNREVIMKNCFTIPSVYEDKLFLDDNWNVIRLIRNHVLISIEKIQIEEYIESKLPAAINELRVKVFVDMHALS